MLHLFFTFFWSWQLMLGHFGLCVGLLVGLYYGLGHFSVVEFWSIQVVFKKIIVNTKQTAIFGLRC